MKIYCMCIYLNFHKKNKLKGLTGMLIKYYNIIYCIYVYLILFMISFTVLPTDSRAVVHGGHGRF